MKYLTIILVFFFSFSDGKKPRELPTDLKSMRVVDFFQPDEILRVWRYPEGGAAFEELFEIKRTGNNWTANRFTYLLDEFRNDNQLQSLRKKEKIELSEDEIKAFVNRKLLHKDTEIRKDIISTICLCDLYRSEYRKGNHAHFFEFNLEEKGNTNISKIKLISFLNKNVLQ